MLYIFIPVRAGNNLLGCLGRLYVEGPLEETQGGRQDHMPWAGKVFQSRTAHGTNEYLWSFARENGISNALSWEVRGFIKRGKPNVLGDEIPFLTYITNHIYILWCIVLANYQHFLPCILWYIPFGHLVVEVKIPQNLYYRPLSNTNNWVL